MEQENRARLRLEAMRVFELGFYLTTYPFLCGIHFICSRNLITEFIFIPFMNTVLPAKVKDSNSHQIEFKDGATISRIFP